MEQNDDRSLESIIQAAKSMAPQRERRRTSSAVSAPALPQPAPSPSGQWDGDDGTGDNLKKETPTETPYETAYEPEDESEAMSFYESGTLEKNAQLEALFQQALNEAADRREAEAERLLQDVGVHFLEFAVAFLSLAKCQYQRENEVKVNSLPFFTLIALDNWADDDYTMSELAGKLQIPKQQLTRLINVLEERGLVERIHDTANRRRVYIRICESGRDMMNEVKQSMLQTTLRGLRSYTTEELEKMDSCICCLTELMEKFDT